MSGELMNKGIEEIAGMSAEELKEVLPRTLDEIGTYGIGKMLEEVPDLLSKIMGKLVAIDAGKFLKEVPEVADKFMDILWEGIGLHAAKSEEMTSVLEKAREMNVNLEASDSPLRGHFIVNQGRISGGSGLLHFKEQDFRFHGPTEVLMKLLSGELALGFSNPRLLTDGHKGLQPLLTPVIDGVSKLIKGEATGV